MLQDLLENALGGLKYKIQGTQGNPSEMERYRRQQLLLERELSHVRSVLARNSKVVWFYFDSFSINIDFNVVFLCRLETRRNCNSQCEIRSGVGSIKAEITVESETIAR